MPVQDWERDKLGGAGASLANRDTGSLRRRVFFDGAEPKNQRNYIWDMYFALTGTSHVSKGQVPITLVTDDGEILRVGIASEGHCRAISARSYREWLVGKQAATDE
jgi:hypothetical protein